MWRLRDILFYLLVGGFMLVIMAGYGLSLWISMPLYLVVLAFATRPLPPSSNPEDMK